MKDTAYLFIYYETQNNKTSLRILCTGTFDRKANDRWDGFKDHLQVKNEITVINISAAPGNDFVFRMFVHKHGDIIYIQQNVK